MSIGYFEFVPSSSILADNLQFSDLCFTDMLDIDYLVDSPIESAILADSYHYRLILADNP